MEENRVYGRLSLDKLMVCAIDFGTTFSGYAFQLAIDFQKDPTGNIKTNQIWNAGTGGLASLKTPTSLLLDKDMEFVAFGYEAENLYSDLASEGDEKDYLFFRRFKMLLHNNLTLNRDTKIAATNGVEVPAKKVFGLGIAYFKDHALQILKKAKTGIKDDDIQWVITVPAIWTDAAKQFMREAAQSANIFNNQLHIALEPEAASILFRYSLTATGDDRFPSGSI